MIKSLLSSMLNCGAAYTETVWHLQLRWSTPTGHR